VDWIHPTQDGIQWRALVNTEIYLPVHKKMSFLHSLLKGICSEGMAMNSSSSSNDTNARTMFRVVMTVILGIIMVANNKIIMPIMKIIALKILQ
jgi:hypothetical protein